MREHVCPEFDCCECGQHVILICGTVTEPPLCAACLTIPGWLQIPTLRAMLDPEGEVREPDLTSIPEWSAS